MTPQDVSAVIVSFGHRASLPTALASLRRIGPSLREVVVVDNAGDLSDGSATRCSPVPPTVLAPGSNLGYAAAANLAVATTHGERLLFLSPDAAILEWSQQRVDDRLGEASPAPRPTPRGAPRLGPPVGAVGALTHDTLDRPTVSWGEFPGASRVLRRLTGARGRFDRRVLKTAASGQAMTVPWVVGAAVLVLRTTFDRVGGYDSFYAAAGEDQDFGRRLELHGLRSVVSSAWRVRHEPRAAETLLPVIRSNELRYLEQYGSRLDRLLWTLVYGTRGR